MQGHVVIAGGVGRGTFEGIWILEGVEGHFLIAEGNLIAEGKPLGSLMLEVDVVEVGEVDGHFKNIIVESFSVQGLFCLR